MSIFELFHVSDMHFRRRSGRGNALTIRFHCNQQGLLPALAATWAQPIGQSSFDSYIGWQLAKFIGSRQDEVDGLVISGDLAGGGSEEDLLAALDLLEARPHRQPELFFITRHGTPTLSAIDTNLFIVPGNHDRYKEPLFSAGGKLFDHVFSKYWPHPHRFVNANVLPHDANGPPLGLIAVDFCLLQNADATGMPYNYVGQGKAYDYMIVILQAGTRKLKRDFPGIGIVWIIHFPPNDEICGASLKLNNSARVVDAAHLENVHLVLCGHLHENSLTKIDQIHIAAAGSGMAFMCSGGNWIHRLTIEVEGGIASLKNRSNYIWSKDADEFVHFTDDLV